MKVCERAFVVSFVMALVFLASMAAQAGEPDLKAAKMHGQAMVDEAGQMMSHGDQGHLDTMMQHAEAMIKHAKEAIGFMPSGSEHSDEAVSRMKEAIDHAEEAVARGRSGNLEMAMAHANKAFAHAKEAKKHIDQM